MILIRCHILGFGKLRDTMLEFQSGLNVVFAANEGGKSTLQRFLVGMLYGQLRSDLKVQRRLDPWVEHYKPWHCREYGGIVWCRLRDGREIEIHRGFGREETRIELRTSVGEEITREYEQQRNGEVLFARTHLGMPKELFESVGIIRENRAAEINGHESIRDRIANLAQSGDEELSIRRSLLEIQDKLDSIGSERAPTKPYRQALDLVQSLQNERKALEERRRQFQGWIEERSRAANETSRLEQELAGIQRALLSARRREVTAKIRMLEELQENLFDLKNGIDALGAREDFPVEDLNELNELMGARDSLGKHLDEIRAEKEQALERLSRAGRQREELAAYAEFAKGNETEKITEWFVTYLSITLQKDGQQKTQTRLEGEVTALENRLSELSAAFRNPESDWQRVAREAAEEEQIASQKCTVLAEKTAVEKSALAEAERTSSNRKLLAGLSLFLGIAPSVVRYGFGLDVLPQSAVIGLGAVLVLVAIILFAAAARARKSADRTREMIRGLEKELNYTRDEGGRKRRELGEVMKNSGFVRIDDFLAAARQAEQDRQKLGDLRARLEEVQQQKERLNAQLEELYLLLKEGLAKAGLSCSPGNLKFQIDVLRANLRRYRELDSQYDACVQKAASLEAREKELADEHEAKCSRIQTLLDQAGVATPEQFREECARRQKLLDMLEKQASYAREFNRLSENLSLEQWKERLDELMAQSCPEGEPEDSQDRAPLLPYLPNIAEAEEREEEIRSKLVQAREEHARAVERVKHAFENSRLSSEIEEDLALAEEDFDRLQKNKTALELALETLQKLSRQQQEVLAPQLNAAVEQRFLLLCNKRYEEVKIDPDFQVWVRETNSGELRLAEHLSRGTQDQLYFSLRFGVLDLISNEDEPCPCLLDEPFAAYDSDRLKQAIGVLTAEASRRQLMLFTCRDDLLELALEEKNVNIIELR